MTSKTELNTEEFNEKNILQSIPEENEESEDTIENGAALIKTMQRNFHLRQFNFTCSKINFSPLNCKENYSTNYESYLSTTLSHFAKLKSLNINFSYALEDDLIYENYPSEILETIIKSGKKKILLLDLDETLIHSDFDETLPEEAYDKIIKFTEKKQSKKEEKNESINESNDTSDSSDIEDDDEEEETFKVGIFVRNSVKEFLTTVSQYFEVGIFTASTKEYADAVIDFLDPTHNLIKFRFYRNNCINVNDMFFVKDLRIIKGIDLKNVVLVDNNIYSFAAQVSNGILINSFYDNKEDVQLKDLLSYLINYIFFAEDVRDVNKQIFGFRNIIEQIDMNSKKDIDFCN